MKHIFNLLFAGSAHHYPPHHRDRHLTIAATIQAMNAVGWQLRARAPQEVTGRRPITVSMLMLVQPQQYQRAVFQAEMVLIFV